MAETQLDVRGLPKREAYRVLRDQLASLVNGIDDPVAVMSTMACVLHLGFGHLWTGFYRRIAPTRLVVGPYQGTIGCMEIEIGRGVCGAAAEQRKTMIVPDVREFPGHIACDARSLSEIVVPVFDHRREVIAVLDIDSEHLSTFDDEDRRQLESWVTMLSQPNR